MFMVVLAGLTIHVFPCRAGSLHISSRTETCVTHFKVLCLGEAQTQSTMKYEGERISFTSLSKISEGNERCMNCNCRVACFSSKRGREGIIAYECTSHPSNTKA